MASISLCMIVKNEEKVLDRCLKSIYKACDEIIIVDTGSTDSTIDIAKKYTNKIYQFEWVDDFSKARNYSFSKATKDYILWLDADDVVSSANLKKIIDLKDKIDFSVDIYMFKYDILFDERGKSTYSYFRERLLKRSVGYIWKDPVHECIELTGSVEKIDIAINHKKSVQKYSNRNLLIYEKLLTNNKLTPRQQFYYARELYYNSKINKAIKEFKNFLKSDGAWVENKISASIDLANCFILKKDYLSALNCLIETFKFSTPRAEVLCLIGKIYQFQNNYYEAIIWYKLARNLDVDLTTNGFYNLDSNGFIPCIELCVCYYRIGDIVSAKYYNKLAGKFKPNNSSYLHNKEFLDNIKD